MTDYSKELTKLIHEGHVLLTEEETQQAVLALLRRVERGASKQPKLGEQPSVSKSLTVVEQLHAIESAACIYNIHYCRAGVGISFYEPEREQRVGGNASSWKDGLVTYQYYPDFEACISAEFNRLTKVTDLPTTDRNTSKDAANAPGQELEAEL